MMLDVLVIVAFGVLVYLGWILRFSWSEAGEGLPFELRADRLIYAERLFRSMGPVSITAKVDRIYRNAADELCCWN